MATANERLFDLALRHQIDLRRFTVGEVKKILRLLEAIDADVAKRLRRDLVGLADGTPLSFTPDQEKRFRILMQDISAVREAAWKQVSEQMNQTTLDLVDTEVAAELAILEDSIPIAVQLAGVDVATVRAAAVARPFQGRLLKDWFSSLEKVEQERLEQAIRLGLTQGENLDTMMTRVLVENLAQRLPASNVFGTGGAISVTPEALVEVNLQRLDQAGPDALVMTAQIAVTLREPRRREIARTESVTVPVTGAHTPAFVASASLAAGRMADVAAALLAP